MLETETESQLCTQHPHQSRSRDPQEKEGDALRLEGERGADLVARLAQLGGVEREAEAGLDARTQGLGVAGRDNACKSEVSADGETKRRREERTGRVGLELDEGGVLFAHRA